MLGPVTNTQKSMVFSFPCRVAHSPRAPSLSHHPKNPPLPFHGALHLIGFLWMFFTEKGALSPGRSGRVLSPDAQLVCLQFRRRYQQDLASFRMMAKTGWWDTRCAVYGVAKYFPPLGTFSTNPFFVLGFHFPPVQFTGVAKYFPPLGTFSTNPFFLCWDFIFRQCSLRGSEIFSTFRTFSTNPFFVLGFNFPPMQFTG
ncbi:hypothetical protein CEXT_311151 [Caerostris extrusa]|uniref:Uncharacterized protein n=1 Tax=Caerostris extrusa TaxID=172846 RepID=A0AAV4WCS9_CAEEX|nr:hypothetical protein CEXT_311151 [Caerostris extrusa]